MSSLSIDLIDGSLIVKSTEILRPNQSSQVAYFLSHYTGQNALDKLLIYLDKQDIPYSLSMGCRDYVVKRREQHSLFENKKRLGREYKEGKFDATSFEDYYRFLEKNIPRKLKQHQIKAGYHLYLVQNAANFSVPGSGKTGVVLSVYEKLKREGKVNLLFVIGPPACFGPWRTEFQLTLGRKPSWKILAGGNQATRKLEYFSLPQDRVELYLTTFQTLLNDQNDLINFLQGKDIKVFLVIDEAHYIKQINGNWANAVLKISEHVNYRCVLTGTPLPKSYVDVFNLFDCLWPNDKPIDSNSKAKIQIEEESGNILSAKELLKATTGPLFYRVRKSELGLMPPEFHSPYILTMNKYERTIYDAIEDKIRTYSEQDYLNNIDLVRKLRRGRIIRLRQCVSYTKLLSQTVEDYKEKLIDDESDLARIICNYDNLEEPAKIVYLKKFVEYLQKRREKVVIWAYFVDTLKLIVKHLTKAGFYCKLIYGDTPIEQTAIDDEETREKIRDEFVDAKSNLDILVANPAACAESISLHKTCFHAVYYDISYNCAQYLQSLDRIHRVGGSETKQANYHFLQYVDTIESDIKNNLERKAQKMYDLIDEDCSIYSLDMFEEEDEIEAYERLFGKK